MSELTQRIQRLMSPEAQEANSREFNVTIDILNAIRRDFRDVASKVDGLRDTVSNMSGDLKEARKDVEYLREGVRTNCARIEKLQEGTRHRTSSKWSDSIKPWSARKDPETEASNFATIAKYVGIVVGAFIMGVGSLVAAWGQLSSAPPVTTPTPPHYQTQTQDQSVWPVKDTDPDDDSVRALKRDEP